MPLWKIESTTDPDLGERPPRSKKIEKDLQRSAKLECQKKKREHKANKTTKKLVLLKQRITVEATLWRTICPFTN